MGLIYAERPLLPGAPGEESTLRQGAEGLPHGPASGPQNGRSAFRRPPPRCYATGRARPPPQPSGNYNSQAARPAGTTAPGMHRGRGGRPHYVSRQAAGAVANRRAPGWRVRGAGLASAGVSGPRRGSGAEEAAPVTFPLGPPPSPAAGAGPREWQR